MTVSGTKMLLLGLGQVAFVFALATVFLFLYNRKLKKRSKTLMERMEAQNTLHRRAVESLKAKLATEKNAPPPPATTVEMPGGEFSGHLNKNIEETEARLKALSAEPNSEFQLEDSAEVIAARMRHAFLESEKLVLAFSTDPALMWETLQPNLDRITIGLRRHNAALMAGDDVTLGAKEDSAEDELKEKLMQLENRWTVLQNEATASLEALDDRYTNLTLALANQSAANHIHEQTDTLTNDFLHLINHITESSHPEKDYQIQLSSIMPEPPSTAGSEQIETKDALDDPVDFGDMPEMELDDLLPANSNEDASAPSQATAVEIPADTSEALETTQLPEMDAETEAEIDAFADSLIDAQLTGEEANTSENTSDAPLSQPISSAAEDDLINSVMGTSSTPSSSQTPESEVTVAADSATEATASVSTTAVANNDAVDDILNDVLDTVDDFEEDTLDELDLSEELSAHSNADDTQTQSVPDTQISEPIPSDTDTFESLLAEPPASDALPSDALPSETEPPPSETMPEDSATPSDHTLDDDVDALLSETADLVDDEDDDEIESYTSSISDSQLDALDEEFEALAGKPLTRDYDLDDDSLSVEPESDANASREGTDATPVTDELDPDAIIAAALAETEQEDPSAFELNMDEATFEDLLADSGVDLHGDLGQK